MEVQSVRVSNVTVRKRLVVVLLGGLFIFAIIAFRLGYVQFVLGDWLTDKAEDSWSRDIPFEAKRGEILDRNDVVLATNISAPSILVVPRQVKNPADTAEQLAAALNMDRKKAYEYITKQESIVRINPEGRKIDKTKANEVRALGLSGVYLSLIHI